MTTEDKAWLAELLNRLPMVRWDRLAGDEAQLSVYGWIDRTDGRRDFVVLNAWLPSPERPTGLLGFTTSSASYSDEIAERLGMDADHTPCRRVEHELQGLVANVVHLS